MSDAAFWTLMAAAGFVLATVGALIDADTSREVWQRATVDRGLALYCPLDGQWAWLGECKE